MKSFTRFCHAELDSASRRYGEKEALNKSVFRAPLRSGFTLLELLVVVLIIGVLVAVALPQYRMSVAKSKYATMKHLVDALVKAEEVYYLGKGEYPKKIEELDINIAGGQVSGDTITLPWGSCQISWGNAARTSCQLNNPRLGYLYYLRHSIAPGVRMCQIWGTDDTTDWRNQVCQAETGDVTANPSSNGGAHLSYNYPHLRL